MISATILTKNSAKTLKATLDSLEGFAEVIVLDSGSTDETLSVAESYPNVKVFASPFLGFGPLHNLAAEKATHDWILSIDSDEVLTGELKEEIFSLNLDPQKNYAFERHNFFKGKRIRFCAGWHPDWVTRLYNKSTTAFTDDLVHEKIKNTGIETVKLSHKVVHTPYLEYADFLAKLSLYTNLYARQYEDKKGGVFSAAFFSWWAFIKNYFFKRGIFGGKEGFLISLYNAHTTFYKYLLISEK